ncbi:MAG: hypothetical protein IJE59_01810 [Clostridia bacterium]|nr:hypothetical protein [Clostridia bacterium]
MTFTLQSDYFVSAWEKDGKIYVLLQTKTSNSLGYDANQNGLDYDDVYTSYGIELWEFEKKEDLDDAMQETDIIYEGTKTSTAGQLRSAISTWYKTLRVIALVGLLSVLVYVGIRIILSSTSQEKAKYKNMVTDWVVAICLLFVLHYIMAFTMQITESILGIFSENTSIVGSNGQDVLMSDVRSDLGEIENANFVTLFSKIIIYIVLVIYTVMFVLQYLKRVVWLAFLTMIAPLITLTYPIDKIKDGKAQAFTMWIREYVFNALLPVIHIILYYMLVGSAMNFITTGENWLYAIVAVGFLMQAEKFFRKMFGFDQASSAGALGAAAGGALVMNAINKMGQKSGKQAAGKSGGGDSGSSSGGATPRYISSPGGNTPRTEAGGEGSAGGNSRRTANDASGNPIGQAGSAFGEEVKDASKAGKFNIGNGAKTLAGHYVNRGNGIKAAKALGRGARKGVVGALGAATLGTAGLAAGVASGDLGKTLQYAGAGAGAGFMGANYLGDKATAFASTNADIIKEGAYGTEEYNTRNSIKELTQDNDFNRVCKELGITDQEGRKKLIRQFHSNGITNAQDIKKAMNVRAGNAGTSQEEIIAAQNIRQRAKQYGMKSKDIEQSLRDKGLGDTEVERAMNLIDQL